MLDWKSTGRPWFGLQTHFRSSTAAPPFTIDIYGARALTHKIASNARSAHIRASQQLTCTTEEISCAFLRISFKLIMMMMSKKATFVPRLNDSHAAAKTRSVPGRSKTRDINLIEQVVQLHSLDRFEFKWLSLELPYDLTPGHVCQWD